MSASKPIAVIIGVGDGLSASLARLLHKEGYQLTLASRDITKLDGLARRVEGTCVACDATNSTQVSRLFEGLPRAPKVAIFNPSFRVDGPLQQLDAQDVKKALDVTAFGSFLFGQQAATAMMNNSTDDKGKKGTILFTGASAGLKGPADHAGFAMGKFAQRGLAQSMARELHVGSCWFPLWLISPCTFSC